MTDVGFVEGTKKILKLNDEEIRELITKLSVEDLNALSAAVTNDDKRTALKIYYKAKDRKLPESINNLNVGDLVYVGKKKIKARVEIPDGPGNTVGIIIGNKTKMINKDKISLDESVLGVTMLPGLARMQELAGIFPNEQETDTPQVTSVELEDDMDDHITCALNALDTLEEVLPDVRLEDAKLIRRRLQDIMVKMNESAPAIIRKRKS